jgi:5-methylcytosine-specific restriction protein A
MRPSPSRRGYGREWNRLSRALRLGGQCLACGTRTDLTVDHLIPLSMGGTHALTNLRVLCRSCHASIGAKSASPHPNW